MCSQSDNDEIVGQINDAIEELSQVGQIKLVCDNLFGADGMESAEDDIQSADMDIKPKEKKKKVKYI